MIHHIELYVSDLEASKRFWGWFLGELGYEVFNNGKTGSAGKQTAPISCLCRRKSSLSKQVITGAASV